MSAGYHNYIYEGRTTLSVAKKKGRRKFNLRRVRINTQTQCGALATQDLIAAAMINTSANKYRIITVKASYSWVNIAAVADDGMTFGLAHSSYTDAEIEECLEAVTSIDIGNKVAQEQANRLVREIGAIESVDVVSGSRVFNDGRLTSTKLNWLIGIGDTVQLWVRNASGTVWTTGSALFVNGSIWVKD